MIYENPPSVRRVETDRPDACAFEITGHISAADIENLYGLLEAEYALHDKVDLLVLIHDYEGFDWSAAFTEGAVVGKSHALKHIRKYAVVGGPDWMRGVMGFFKPFFSIEMKHFDLDKAEDAWTWLGATPVQAA